MPIIVCQNSLGEKYTSHSWAELRSEYRQQARFEGDARRRIARCARVRGTGYCYQCAELRETQRAARANRSAVERELRRRQRVINTAGVTAATAPDVRPIDTNLAYPGDVGPIVARHMRGGSQ